MMYQQSYTHSAQIYYLTDKSDICSLSVYPPQNNSTVTKMKMKTKMFQLLGMITLFLQ